VKRLALAAVAAFTIAAAPPAKPAPVNLSMLDILELDICYTTMMARYYKPVTGAQLLGGARTGMLAYLRSRGIADPQLPAVSATVDRYRAEDELSHFVVLALSKYGKVVEPDRLVRASCAGQLSSVNDPYTILFEPQQFKAFNSYLDGEQFGGIGVLFAPLVPGAATFTDGASIEDVFPDGPADKAGIQPGDILTAVDGKPLATLTPDAARTLIRGPIGSAVSLNLLRQAGSEASHLTIQVTRAAVTPPEVTSRLLPGAIGYMALRNFGADSAKQMAHAIDLLRKRGARAYILDLRNNGGGYEADAVNIASLFVSGTVVSVQERTGPPKVFTAKPMERLGAPLAVLVNGESASGSEIVAAAIQDDKAGTLVGVKTFGKGLVQEVYPLPDKAALKITTARYFTPAGRDINGTGVTPDIIVEQPPDARLGVPGSDPQLDRALNLLKS
jgi:carboxyl-terminal processing protease